jgi:hypothetical protein
MSLTLEETKHKLSFLGYFYTFNGCVLCNYRGGGGVDIFTFFLKFF